MDPVAATKLSQQPALRAPLTRVPRVIYVVFLLSLAVPIISLPAQSQTMPDLTSVDQLGAEPYSALHGGDIDSVGLQNGTLSLHVPILSYPQRGSLKLSFDLMYNNQPQHIGKLCVPPDPCLWEWGWPPKQLGLPLEAGDVFVGFAQAAGVVGSVAIKTTTQPPKNYYYGNWSILTADGTKHSVGNQGTVSFVQHQGDTTDDFQQATGPFEALDATGWRTLGAETASSAINQSGGMGGSPTAIISPDGNYYGPTISDPNGNTMTYTS